MRLVDSYVMPSRPCTERMRADGRRAEHVDASRPPPSASPPLPGNAHLITNHMHPSRCAHVAVSWLVWGEDDSVPIRARESRLLGVAANMARSPLVAISRSRTVELAANAFALYDEDASAQRFRAEENVKRRWQPSRQIGASSSSSRPSSAGRRSLAAITASRISEYKAKAAGRREEGWRGRDRGRAAADRRRREPAAGPASPPAPAGSRGVGGDLPDLGRLDVSVPRSRSAPCT